MITGRRARAGRAADMYVAAILYVIVLAGSFAFVRGAVDGAPNLPDLREGATAILLAMTPAAILVALGLSLYRFAREYARKAWGTRIKLRLAALFVATAVMASVPPAVLLGLLAVRAMELPETAGTRDAVDAGLGLALSYFGEKDKALEYAAQNDFASMVAVRGADAALALSRLSGRDGTFCAVEFFRAGHSVAFAGDEAARIPGGAVPADRTGFLPRLSAGGATYSRFFARDAGIAPDAGPLSAVVTMRVPAEAEAAAGRLEAAKAALGASAGRSRSFPLYMAFLGASLVAPLVMLALAFATAAADALLRPIGALDQAIRRVDSGVDRAPLLAKTADETGALVEAFNAMLDRLERSGGDRLRTEKMEAWRDMARSLAHELRNPLTPIRLTAERVLKRWKADPVGVGDILERSMVAIVQETIGMDSLLTEFSEFARLPEPQKDWVELAPLVQEAVHLYSASWPEVRFDATGVDPGTVLKVDRRHLKQALGNLIANAADATDGRGCVWIRSDLVKTAGSGYCRIQVRDDGRGIPAELRDKVFSPYFTTKADGTGLGLAIVEHIAAAHGGRVWFDSAEGAGTVFHVDLPMDPR